MGSALVGVCVPNFWIALIFISFVAVQWHWLPAMGYAPLSAGLGKNLRYMVLPAVTLGFNQSALIARITRACMLEILQMDFIRTARAKGLPERAVIQWHAFRDALIPVVTVIGVTFAILIGGAIVTEVVFNIPGLGRLLISGILRRDYPVVQGAVLFITATYVAINLLVDLAYALIDPRVKHGCRLHPGAGALARSRERGRRGGGSRRRGPAHRRPPRLPEPWRVDGLRDPRRRAGHGGGGAVAHRLRSHA